MKTASSPGRSLGVNSEVVISGKTLIKCPLSRINGVHPAIESLHGQLSIPPLRAVPGRAISPRRIESLISLLPLRVTKVKGRLCCSGNVRLYQLALRLLPDDTAIECIVEATVGEAALQHRYLREVTDVPACLGAHFSDSILLAETFRKATRAGIFESPDRPLDLVAAELYGIDRRRLKAASDKAESQPEGAPDGNGAAHASETDSEITPVEEPEPVTSTSTVPSAEDSRREKAIREHAAATLLAMRALGDFGLTIDEAFRVR